MRYMAMRSQRERRAQKEEHRRNSTEGTPDKRGSRPKLRAKDRIDQGAREIACMHFAFESRSAGRSVISDEGTDV